MDLFLKGEQSDQRDDLESALQYYTLSLERESLEEESRVVCCDRIHKISHLLDCKLDFNTKCLLAETYFRALNYPLASQYYRLIPENKRNKRIYEAFWESEFQNGNIFQAKQIAYRYLLYCKRRKLYDCGIEMLEKLKKIGLFEKKYQIVEIELELGRGNKPPVLNRFKEIAKTGVFLEDERESYWAQIKQNWNFWTREAVVRDVFFQSWSEELKSKQVPFTDTQARRNMMILAREDLLLGGEACFSMFEYYAECFQKETKTPPSQDCSTQIFTDTQKLQRNIEFILGDSPGIQEIKKAHPLLYELKEREPDHPLIVKYLDNQKGQDIERTLDEIRAFASSGKKELSHMRTDAFLYGLDQSFLVDHGEDLMVSLITMELYESALKLMDKIRDDISGRTDKYKTNLAYLELVALKKSGKGSS